MLNDYDIFFDKALNSFQIRTKFNSVEIEFDDDSKREIFEYIAQCCKNYSLYEIYNKALKRKFNKAEIIEILQGLYDYEIITDLDILESGLNFFENVNNSYRESELVSIEESRILIIGDGLLSNTLLKCFSVEKFASVALVSYDEAIELYSSNSFYKLLERIEFCVIDTNQWSPFFLMKFNESMLKINKPWLHVGGVEEISLKIGPLFFGKETGCYNCLIQRVKSNHEFADHLISYENYLAENKISSKPDNLPHVKILYTIISNYALLETLKFLEGWAVPEVWKSVLSVNAFSYKLTKHTLLKVPYCEYCKPELQYNLAVWLEPITL